MSTSKVTGVIDGISDYGRNDYFNIALEDSEQDDNWYIGDGTLRDFGQFDKGDKVRLTVDDNKGSVTNVEPVGKPQNDVTGDDGGSESDKSSQSAPNGSEGGQTSSDNFSSKDDRINKKVAFKEACETIRDREKGTDPANLSDGAHIEDISRLANGYYNILKDMGDEQ